MVPPNIPEVEVSSLGSQIDSLALQTDSLVITTNEGYSISCDLLRGWVQVGKQIDDAFDPQIKAFHDGHKIALAQKKKFKDPVDTHISQLKLNASKYLAEQERIRRAEEARLQAIAQAEADAEAKRLADEQAVQDAIELEAAGDTKGAEAVLNNPAPVAVYVPPVILQKIVPKAEGISSRQTWKFRVVNPSLVPRTYLIVDEKAVGQVVRALKEKASIPGIEIFAEENIAVRA